MKHENIQRLKEFVFLSAFVILLFSFSNRAFTKSQGAEKKEAFRGTLSCFKAVHPAPEVSVKNPPTHSLFFSHERLAFKLSGAELAVQMSDLIRKNRLTQQPEFYRLYYHVFSARTPEDPA